MKFLLSVIAAITVFCATGEAQTGVLNPDGSITYTVWPNGDVLKSPVPLAAVEIGPSGVGSYQWQALTAQPGLAVGDAYDIAWNRTWRIGVGAQGQHFTAVGGAFYGHHGGEWYAGNPEPILNFTPAASSVFLSRRERNMFVGSGLVGLEWDFATGNTGSVTAWSASTGFVGTGYVTNSLSVQFQVTYYPATRPSI